MVGQRCAGFGLETGVANVRAWTAQDFGLGTLTSERPPLPRWLASGPRTSRGAVRVRREPHPPGGPSIGSRSRDRRAMKRNFARAASGRHKQVHAAPTRGHGRPVMRGVWARTTRSERSGLDSPGFDCRTLISEHSSLPHRLASGPRTSRGPVRVRREPHPPGGRSIGSGPRDRQGTKRNFVRGANRRHKQVRAVRRPFPGG